MNKGIIIALFIFLWVGTVSAQEIQIAQDANEFTAQFKEVQSYSAMLAQNPFLALFGVGLALREDPNNFPTLAKVPYLTSWYVLIALGILALIALFSEFEPTSGTLQQWFSDNLGKMLAIAVPLIALASEAVQTQTAEVVVVRAGFLGEFAVDPKVAVLSTIAIVNFYVIATVRFAFSVIISFFSPVPWVSGVFSILRSLFVGALIFLYSWHPIIAVIINVLIFLFALLVFRWAYRLGRYVKQVTLEPVVHGIFHSKKPRQLVIDKLPRRTMARVKLSSDDLEMAIPVFVLKCPKISKRVKCYLFKWKNQDEALLMVPRLIRKPRVISWPVNGDRSFLGDALLHVEFLSYEGENLRSKFAASRGFAGFKEDLQRLLNADDVGAVGVKKQLKNLGKQAQGLVDGAQGAIDKFGAFASKKVKGLKQE